MSKHVLITGGAGFIGSHLADALLAAGWRVRILDNLCEQVHAKGTWPDYLAPDIDLRFGDVRDQDAITAALQGVDAVYHFASRVGVGQSMYQVGDYVGVNDLGTANLLQVLTEQPLRRLIIASSMSIYGEGMYMDADGLPVEGNVRNPAQLKAGDWDLRDGKGRPFVPVATPESKRPALASVYALSKYVQERLCLLIGEAYGIPTVALRFFNAYGPRQSLSNPYTGVLAIFSSRLINGNSPIIFEDGHQKRDFVHVSDVVQACLLALEEPSAPGKVFNVGSGRISTIGEIALKLADIMGTDLSPEISGKYRAGDIRHCFADIGLARQVLGYNPRVSLEAGLHELVDWLSGQLAVDNFEEARRELARRGLTA